MHTYSVAEMYALHVLRGDEHVLLAVGRIGGVDLQEMGLEVF